MIFPNSMHNHDVIIPLGFEDGTVLNTKPLMTIKYDGREFVALIHADDSSDDVYFYEFRERGENDIEIINIEDGNTLDAILDEFQKWVDEEDKKQD